MTSRLTPSIFAALCLGLSGCATHGVDRADRNQFVTEFYAFVQNIEQVEFASHARTGAAIGATSGVLDNIDGDRGDMIGGAIVGALFGGVITALLEGPSVGYEYELHAVDGDAVSVVVDYYPAEIGDCVKVRVSGSVHIEPASLSACEDEMAMWEE